MASQQSAEFQRINQIFENEVIGGKNFGAVSQVYTTDARILPPGADVLGGLDHIAAFWEQTVATLGVQSLKLSTVDLQVTGDVAVEIGTAELVTNQPTSPNNLKYVVVWKREGEGWKWQIDIWNAASESQQK